MSSDFIRSWWIAVLVVYPLIIIAVALVLKLTGSVVLAIVVGVVLFAVRLKVFRRPSSEFRHR